MKITSFGLIRAEAPLKVLRDCRDEYICLHLIDRGFESAVIPRKEMVAAAEGILSDKGIRSQGSPSEMTVWNAKRDATGK
jgi:hypothetical protein